MRIYISCDMEGVAGIVEVDQTHRDGHDFARSCQLMTDEVNAAALGAFDAGAKEVLINDSHADMYNLLWDRLDPRVQVISGSHKPFSMVQGAEGRYDGAFFVGYHAGMGARGGVMDHTYIGSCVGEVRVNGRVLNETGINALVCGAFGTPVALVAGDERCSIEAKKILGDVETVVVKWGTSRYSGRSLHPAESCRRIREVAQRAAGSLSRFKPFRLKPPYRLRVRVLNSGMADSAALMPGVTRVDGTTVEYGSRDLLETYRALMVVTRLAAQSIPKIRTR